MSGAAPLLYHFSQSIPAPAERGHLCKVPAGGERVTHRLKLVQVERLLLTYPRSAPGTGRCLVQGLGAARPAACPVAVGQEQRQPASHTALSREPGQGTHGQSSGLKGWADASRLILLLIEGLLE